MTYLYKCCAIDIHVHVPHSMPMQHDRQSITLPFASHQIIIPSMGKLVYIIITTIIIDYL